MFDRGRLAGILRDGPGGDTRDLAEEVVRLMGANAEAEERARGLKLERDMWEADARQAKIDRANLVDEVAAVLEAVPKSRRPQFAELERRLSAS